MVVGSLVAVAMVSCAADVGRRRTAAGLAFTVPALVVAGMVAGAGAWSVDEPGASTLRLVAGNGVVVGVNTHAFLIQQGDVILCNDGLTPAANFLDSPDPRAPYRRTAGGTLLPARESYLWRAQLGARDADGVLKHALMPDHFFNWWTHSGKGMIVGPSSATWAEQQFAEAVQSWGEDDRSKAMYHLGAATHLVNDACAPPQSSQYVPDHCAYEDWVVAHQARYAVTRGGIYRADFACTPATAATSGRAPIPAAGSTNARIGLPNWSATRCSRRPTTPRTPRHTPTPWTTSAMPSASPPGTSPSSSNRWEDHVPTSSQGT